MLSSVCWGCSRPLLNATPKPTPAWGRNGCRASFTTTASRARATTMPKKKGLPGKPKAVHKKGQKAFSLSKKKGVPAARSSKLPAPGERKAWRKQVILKNTNAIDIRGIQEFTAGNLRDEKAIGQVLAIPAEIVQQLSSLMTFRHTQMWRMFRRPGILARQHSIQLAREIEAITAKNPRSSGRKIVVGERASGKSVYILEASAMALSKGWIVINLPESHELVNGRTEYYPLPESDPVQYQQNNYTSELLARTLEGNKEVLDQIYLAEPLEIGVSLSKDSSLSVLCQVGIQDKELATTVWKALWTEITRSGRPPILVATDGIEELMRLSQYKNSSYESIHSHDLFMVSWFLDYLFGKLDLPNGGLAIASTTESNKATASEFSIRIKQLEAKQSILKGQAGSLVSRPDPYLPFLIATGQNFARIPAADPFEKYDTRIFQLMGSAFEESPSNHAENEVQIVRIENLDKLATKSLLEYWAKCGVVRAEVSDWFVTDRWAVASNGVIGELERCCIQAANL